MKAAAALRNLKPSKDSSLDIASVGRGYYEAMNDDLNTPLLLSRLFDSIRYINSVNEGTDRISGSDLETFRSLFSTFVFDILGLKNESADRDDEKLTSDLMKIIIDLRQDARNRKEWEVSDHIREELKKAGIVLNDTREGMTWSRE